MLDELVQKNWFMFAYRMPMMSAANTINYRCHDYVRQIILYLEFCLAELFQKSCGTPFLCNVEGSSHDSLCNLDY